MLKLITVFFMLMLISACNQPAHTNVGHQSGMKMAQQNNAIKKSPGYHQTVKPHADIAMRYAFLNRIVLNEPLQLKLMFKVKHSAESLQIKIISKSGLTVLSSQTDFLLNNLTRGADQTLLIELLPEQFGEHTLIVSATINTIEASQSRTFEVPVNLPSNNVQKQSADKIQKGATFHPGQNVISMPASESTQ